MATQPRRRAPRSDAQGNRARIIELAREAFTENPGATLQSIAKSAGVGQGTMYRHFPHREALLIAVYREDVEALIEAAPRLLSAHRDDPVEALRRWLDLLAAYGRIKHGASLAVEAATRADLGSQYYPPVIEALGSLLAAGQRAGRLRPDLDPDEVLLLVSFLWRGDNGPDWQPRTRHMLDLVLDGLRVRPPQPSGAR
ncbi:TetR/AcrR family transcriptional regulator [Phaeacidiphilus oryzae]|uniref:TetR/AcrR family transcriptional regulator n=1 Tax=Phaeacidiphilus oryzae TaxID=348818 RepID=UPI000559FE8E|nr:TetR/AcrR family transcriptional regulator [Phaeacidiphilus oryzae]